MYFLIIVELFLSENNLLAYLLTYLLTYLHSDENILYFDEDFGNDVFNCNEMGILDIDLNCINLDNNNFDKDDPDYYLCQSFGLAH